jgi:hypothetical protein
MRHTSRQEQAPDPLQQTEDMANMLSHNLQKVLIDTFHRNRKQTADKITKIAVDIRKDDGAISSELVVDEMMSVDLGNGTTLGNLVSPTDKPKFREAMQRMIEDNPSMIESLNNASDERNWSAGVRALRFACNVMVQALVIATVVLVGLHFADMLPPHTLPAIGASLDVAASAAVSALGSAATSALSGASTVYASLAYGASTIAASLPAPETKLFKSFYKASYATIGIAACVFMQPLVDSALRTSARRVASGASKVMFGDSDLKVAALKFVDTFRQTLGRRATPQGLVQR